MSNDNINKDFSPNSISKDLTSLRINKNIHPFNNPDLMGVMSKNLHVKDMINLHSVNNNFRQIFNKEFIQKTSAAIKIQKYFRRYRVEKILPYLFFDKILKAPLFRKNYFYIHEPIIDDDPWLFYMNGEECTEYPHICLKDDKLTTFFCRIYIDAYEFTLWVETHIDKKLRDNIDERIKGLKNLEEREKMLETEIFR